MLPGIKRGTREPARPATGRMAWMAAVAWLCALTMAAAGPRTGSAATAAPAVDEGELRATIEAMKQDPRGPFDQIRWFCKDGTRLLPRPDACKPHGGGHQHGQWSARTLALRAAGYRIATFLADLDPAALIAEDAALEPLAQILIEQFLVRADDGWILRKARYYRGAFQEEGERKGARALLRALLAEPDALSHRFLLLRSAVGSLPHGPETASVRAARQLAATLSERDPAFKPLRNKIHGRMDATDAAAVRAYAAGSEDPSGDFARLADMLDALYARDTDAVLGALASHADSAGNTALGAAIGTARTALAAPDRAARAAALATLLGALRDAVREAGSPDARLALLDASLALESDYLTLHGELLEDSASWSRRRRLEFLAGNLDALYGTGAFSARQRAAMQAEIAGVLGAAPTAAAYKRAIDYLALAPHWATQAHRFVFGEALDRFLRLEPRSALFIQDALRGSPLFGHARIVDTLVRDANQQSRVRNMLFGTDPGGGLRGLNPGLARGTLHLATPGQTAFARDGIYVLPETVADLPPVRGIVTAGEGNPLSHVQLLARNLGIPNVAIEQRLVETLRPHDGQEILLAVSPRGAVQIARIDAALAARLEDDSPAETRPVITVDLAKLDLDRREFINLRDLRAEDSGRTVGPKAAKLGELKQHYPDAVASGLALPFGLFRQVLEQPMPDAPGLSIFAWMQREYARLATLPDGSDARMSATETFRARLEALIASLDAGPAFRAALAGRLREVFGADGAYGVFVRSDTNVEDLPGFTGAGLNLTLPNVVGEQAIVAGIAKVWASPFTARAFAWRQSLMTTPEHVYPAVLLLESVDNDKSGVLVTRDIDTGSEAWLSVALNEGVGGAVDGQSAESLRIRVADGSLRLLAQATAPRRRQIAPTGGVAMLAASGAEQVLQPAEAAQLVTLARELPTRFPPIVDADGKAAPADIEFGFQRGKLRLFQIRPFLDNTATRATRLLQEMDRDAEGQADSAAVIDLEAVP